MQDLLRGTDEVIVYQVRHSVILLHQSPQVDRRRAIWRIMEQISLERCDSPSFLLANPIGDERHHQWKIEIMWVESLEGARYSRSCRVRPDAMARRPSERVDVEVGSYRYGIVLAMIPRSEKKKGFQSSSTKTPTYCLHIQAYCWSRS